MFRCFAPSRLRPAGQRRQLSAGMVGICGKAPACNHLRVDFCAEILTCASLHPLWSFVPFVVKSKKRSTLRAQSAHEGHENLPCNRERNQRELRSEERRVGKECKTRW